MEREKEQKNNDNPVISPLANEKTYGERMYSRVFDWGLNYWTNLLASAGMSHWAENSEKPFRIPSLMQNAISPRQWQQNIATWVREHDPVFKWFAKSIRKEMVGESEHLIQQKIFERSMARTRSLVLLIPGFFVMIPSVWLGAKVKPKLVEWWNKHHYGEEAMDDPSLQARHAAIAAEARPTFLGSVFARFATVIAAQITAQMFGSDKNWLQRAGLKNFKGIDPFTEKLGSTLGGTLPEGLREAHNRTVQRWGYNWSLDQQKNARALNLNVTQPYYHATQDLGRFIIADTVYTFVTASTVGMFTRWLPKLPFLGRFMSYKTKAAANGPIFDADGKVIKVPRNRYADRAPEGDMTPSSNDAASLDVAHPEPAANDEKIPESKVSQIRREQTLAPSPTLHHAGAGA